MVHNAPRWKAIDGARWRPDGEEVVLARYTASGRGSGVQLEGEHGYVWTVRDGEAVRFLWFQSHREALDAAGLSELA